MHQWNAAEFKIELSALWQAIEAMGGKTLMMLRVQEFLRTRDNRMNPGLAA